MYISCLLCCVRSPLLVFAPTLVVPRNTSISYFKAGGKKRKQEDDDHDVSPPQSKKKRKLDLVEKDEKSGEVSSSVVFPEEEKEGRSVSGITSTVDNQQTFPKQTKTSDNEKPVVGKKVTPVKITLPKNSATTLGKSNKNISPGKTQPSLKKKSPNTSIKGKLVIHRAIIAKRDAIKSSTVTPVCQKGGILRSVPLSTHPVLVKDLKLARSQYNESVFHDRCVCPYCTYTGSTAVLVRRHISDAHKGKDPTVIDRLSYVRKQRCKTFYCWNPQCDFQTAVCEERESHVESTECGAIYEKLNGEPVPKVKEKKTPINKKSVNKINLQEQTNRQDVQGLLLSKAQDKNKSSPKTVTKETNDSSSVQTSESNGVQVQDKYEKLQQRILELLEENASHSMERAELLKCLENCTEFELSYILRGMAEDNEVICSGPVVILV